MSRKFFSIRICLYLLNLFKKKNRKFNNPKKIKFIFNFTFESHISISALKNSNFTENINKQIFFCRFYLQLSFVFFKKICRHHFQFNIAITYFMFQGSKRDFYQRQNFSERKSSIPFREMLAFSFLPSNETKSKDKPK